ncbi:MAG: ABC transporter permease [Fimbriimonadaceae bacterium]|nr:ABC transporter permease [Fimbriimonadaceae bacterium]QYK57099.1 MAG: ABC transporter permease [Fimbriimonadaceae bacterium]
MNRALTIFLKELRETFRDRRVVQAAFVMPVFMILLMVFLFGMLEKKLSEPPRPEIAVVGQEVTGVRAALLKGLAGETKYVADRESGVKMLREGKVKLVVQFDPDFEEKVASGQTKMQIVFDPTNTMSQISAGTVRKAVEALNVQRARATFEAAGYPGNAVEPIKLQESADKPPEGLGGSLLAGLLPYLIVLWAFYGGMSLAADMVAGEKERGTLETLLTTPVSRMDIVVGKALALGTTCLCSAGSSLIALLVVGAMGLPATREMFPSGLSLPVTSVLTLLLVIVSLVAMFTTILMAVSSYAKTMREAQTYLTLVSFAVLMPAVSSQFIGFTGAERAPWIRWTPVLNAAMSLRDALVGRIDWGSTVATVGLSFAIAVVFAMLTVRLFKDERILGKGA